MNNTNFIGRLTAEPELRRTNSGTPCCSFSLAVKRPKVKDTTDFLNFVVWQQGAEYLAKYGHKGDLVGVTGYLISRSWEDKNGNKRISFEVTCEAVELLSSKKSSEDSQTQATPNMPTNRFQYPQKSVPDYAMLDDVDAQLPF